MKNYIVRLHDWNGSIIDGEIYEAPNRDVALINSCVARQQIVGVEYAAERLATEAIQTAAMCKKFIQSEV